MGPTTEKVDLSTTQSDLIVLQEKGFILEKIIGEGSYAKVFSFITLCLAAHFV